MAMKLPTPPAEMTPEIAAAKRKAALSFMAEKIRQTLDTRDRQYWPEILELTGIKELLEMIPKKIEGPILGEADEDTLAVLDQMSIEAMKAGMDPKSPNAQMVRAYHAWREMKEGEKQLEGVTINVVPASVPDEMEEMLRQQIEGLTEVASRS